MTGTFELIGEASRTQEAAVTANADIGPSKIQLISEKAQISQEKRMVAVLDSSAYGGSAAVNKLHGLMTLFAQFGGFPLGEKCPALARAFTAAAILWTLCAPLATGEDHDGKVAENAIIACNTACIHREAALEIVKEFCEKVYNDGKGACDKGLSEDIRKNIVDLHLKISDNANYLEDKVHGIISKTIEKSLEKVDPILKNKDIAFVRLDSTNGTSRSKAYLDGFKKQLQKKYGDVNYHDLGNDINIDRSNFSINHGIFSFTDQGKTKTLIVENRGNPDWADAIERGEVADRGMKLVETSQAASSKANEKVIEWLNTDGNIVPSEQVAGLQAMLNANRPGLSVTCCTHFPAMQNSLRHTYGKESGVVYVNQDEVVKSIVEEIYTKAGQEPPTGPLELAITVGTQNRNGTPGNLIKSVPDGKKTARDVLDLVSSLHQETYGTTENQPAPKSVKIFQQGRGGEPGDVNPENRSSFKAGEGVGQFMYELIQSFIGRGREDEIWADQGLKKREDGTFELTNPANAVKPKLDSEPKAKVISDFCPPVLREKYEKLGELMAMGETRGIDRLSKFNAQGEQLQAGVSQLIAVSARNKGKAVSEQERVGILTGFTVIDNKTGARVGGENDGPPGTAVMARTFIQRGQPVTIITDKSNEASVVSAFVGAGLIELTDAGKQRSADKRTLEFVKVAEGINPELLKFEVPDFDNADTLRKKPEEREAQKNWMRLGQNEKIAETVENLQKAKVSTIISIERPSVTQYDGGLYSMLGLDVSPYNTDMSPVLGSGEYRPFTIGIGDGGNELGTGGIQEKTANLRGPDLKPVVKRGEFIGAKREHATDVMLLSSASNSGGIALAMAFEAGMKAVADDVWRADLALKLLKNYETKKQAHEGSVYQQRVNAKKEMDTAKDALDKSTRAHAASFAAYEKPRKQLDDIIESYPRIIKHMHGEGMSLDGVNKENYETVDGRRVGTLREARKRFEEQEGVIRLGIGPVAEKPEGRDEDSTHNDLFLAFRKALTSEPFKVTTQ